MLEIRYFLERGRVYYSSGDKKKTSEQFHLAYNKTVKYKEDYYAVDAAHMLGISEEENE